MHPLQHDPGLLQAGAAAVLLLLLHGPAWPAQAPRMAPQRLQQGPASCPARPRPRQHHPRWWQGVLLHCSLRAVWPAVAWLLRLELQQWLDWAHLAASQMLPEAIALARVASLAAVCRVQALQAQQQQPVAVAAADRCAESQAHLLQTLAGYASPVEVARSAAAAAFAAAEQRAAALLLLLLRQQASRVAVLLALA